VLDLSIFFISCSLQCRQEALGQEQYEAKRLTGRERERLEGRVYRLRMLNEETARKIEEAHALVTSGGDAAAAGTALAQLGDTYPDLVSELHTEAGRSANNLEALRKLEELLSDAV